MDAHGCRLGVEKRTDFIQKSRDGDYIHRRLGRSGIGQKVSHQLGQTTDLATGRGQGGSRIGLLIGEIFIEQLEIEIDGIQGISDLVSEIGGEGSEGRELFGVVLLGLEFSCPLHQEPHQNKRHDKGCQGEHGNRDGLGQQFPLQSPHPFVDPGATHVEDDLADIVSQGHHDAVGRLGFGDLLVGETPAHLEFVVNRVGKILRGLELGLVDDPALGVGHDDGLVDPPPRDALETAKEMLASLLQDLEVLGCR